MIRTYTNMNKSYKIKRTNVKVKLCQTTVRTHQIITKEILKILGIQDGNRFNDKLQKKAKRFPAQTISYEQCIEKYSMKNGTITSSLSSKNVPKQIKYSVPIILPLNLSFLQLDSRTLTHEP